jgi:hypothetical protein
MRSWLRSKLENILAWLDTKTKKSTIFALNQVRKLGYICQSTQINVKFFLILIGNASTITKEGFFIKTVLRFVNPNGLPTLFGKTS